MKRLFILILIMILCISFLAQISAIAQTGTSDSLRGAASSIDSLKLKGTLFAKNLKPMAIIEDTKSGKTTMYELGDSIGKDLRITSITRGEIICNGITGEYRLSLPQGAVQQLQSKIPNSDTINWYKINRQGNTFSIDEATVANAIYRAKDIARDVKIKPCSIDGKPSGLLIEKLNEVGILKEIGVKEGDVLKTINGLTLNSPYQIFNAYRNLRNEKELKVDIIRGNKPLVLTYKITK